MKNAIYLATSHDCAANLAGEAYLLTLAFDHILFLWVNDPCIVIGRYQNPFAECNLKNMEHMQVQLVRRQSGGGAVYHDQGNLCFTLIGNKETATKEENFSLVLKALASLGLSCELSGRNDILLDGKKISGNAFQTTPTKFCHHGTLLVSSDLSVMSNYLTPSSTKLASKAVKSVSSRVGNLKEGREDITNEMVQQALIDAFIAEYGQTEVTPIDCVTLAEAQANYRRFGDLSVILEKTPQFTHSFTHRFEWGEATLHLQVEKGVISEVRMFTDALDTSIVGRATQVLTGLPYDHNALTELARKSEQADLASLLMHVVTLL
ncbi:lipoate--protein ligase [Sphaerochaeta globosa]|jgi:lipoate-protein ligase A|uniref:lipoate--protein ligase n=1 Tax=Sphaerochaeta globosa (strain ATCC BAA-1886 / DSM 22777 / Buddy) TaxID=158189 RepID=F0RY99_SPHGB|nr:lipoate--protein ligase [Sphaerochaeta globosa]ADY12598.1 lipoyltransferase and lipoate-protein ligase [Sphaerochaeta globosa str. Buddy]